MNTATQTNASPANTGILTFFGPQVDEYFASAIPSRDAIADKAKEEAEAIKALAVDPNEERVRQEFRAAWLNLGKPSEIILRDITMSVVISDTEVPAAAFTAAAEPTNVVAPGSAALVANANEIPNGMAPPATSNAAGSAMALAFEKAGVAAVAAAPASPEATYFDEAFASNINRIGFNTGWLVIEPEGTQSAFQRLSLRNDSEMRDRLRVGETATSIDDTGRQMIIVNTHLGLVVVHQQVAGNSNLLAYDGPDRFITTGLVRPVGTDFAAEMVGIIGNATQANIGVRYAYAIGREDEVSAYDPAAQAATA